MTAQTTSIGTLIRMREWADRIRRENERDAFYSQPDKKLALLEHFHGEGFLKDWPPISDSIQ